MLAFLDFSAAFDAGASDIATKAGGDFWHFWHCASLVRVLVRGP